LTFLLTKTNPSKRLQRWLERLSSYSFTILYKPGKENLVADALSRVYDDEELVPVAPSDEDYNDSIVAAIDTTPPHHTFSLIAAINPMVERDTHEELRRQQADDPDIMWTINLISTHGDYRPEDIVPNSPIQRVFFKNYGSLRIINGVLYKESEDEYGNVKQLYVLPSKEVTKVIDKLHASVYGAHLGRKKTKTKVGERFYRPFLMEWVEAYLKTCESCQKIKTLTQKTQAELRIIRPTHTNNIIASDFAGPFNITPRGNRYIQVISDLYSKYMMVLPQPNKESRTAATAIVNKWCCTFGIPDICLTDEGGENTSRNCGTPHANYST